MSQKILTIAIPTFNHASELSNLLDNILIETEGIVDEIEICISNNASEDNTDQVVEDFRKKYGGQVKYNKNDKNLGVDANILKILQMAEGKFVWTFGADDLFLPGAILDAFNFIKSKENILETIGLIVVRSETFYSNNGSREIYRSTLDKKLPDIFEIKKEEIISFSFPDIAFLSALVLNGKLLRSILSDDFDDIKLGLGSHHILSVFLAAIFLKFENALAFALNYRNFVSQEMPSYKFFVEDKFMLHYQVQKKIYTAIASNKYIGKYKQLVLSRLKKLRVEFIHDLVLMKIFNSLKYLSFMGCLKLFFKEAPFFDALIFSVSFIVLHIMPQPFLQFLYYILFIFKNGSESHKKWQTLKNASEIFYRGVRRRNDLVK